MKSQELWLSDPTVLLHKDHISELWPKNGTSLEAKLNAGSRLVIILSLLGYLFTMNISFFIIGFITLAIIGGLYNINNSHASISEAAASLLKTGGKDKDKEGFAVQGGGHQRGGMGPAGVAVHGDFTAPTPSNPLMNVLLPEIKYAPGRANAMPAFSPQVEAQINESTKAYISTNFDASSRNAVQPVGPDSALASASASEGSQQSEQESRDIYNKLFSNLGDSCEFEHSMRNFYATPNTRVNNDQEAFAKFCYGDMRSCKEGDEFACSRNSSRIGQIVGA